LWVELRFPARLAEMFLYGNRSKLAVLPGNRDVDWQPQRSTVTRVDDSVLRTNAVRDLPNAKGLFVDSRQGSD
jgi:hypothetical protein